MKKIFDLKTFIFSILFFLMTIFSFRCTPIPLAYTSQPGWCDYYLFLPIIFLARVWNIMIFWSFWVLEYPFLKFMDQKFFSMLIPAVSPVFIFVIIYVCFRLMFFLWKKTKKKLFLQRNQPVAS